MLRYADPTLCPDCREPLPVDPDACPACDLPLKHPLAPELFRTLQLADTLLTRLRTERARVPEPITAGLPTYPVRRAEPVRRTGIRTASVPAILLGLGALCLIVAALIFLAVAWSFLGIGGRTAVLVGLTGLAAAAGAWFGGKGLRVAAESLTTVSLGLVALDVAGAVSAGWFGTRDDGSSIALLGAGVALLSAALASSRLVSPQLGLAIGTTLVAVGLALTDHPRTVATLAVLVLVGLVHLGRRTGLRALAGASATLALTWWSSLLLVGLEDAMNHASWSALWLDRQVAALLAAGLLLLLTRHRLGVAASLGVLTAVVAMPVVDEGGTALAATAAGILLVTSLVPARWRDLASAPALVAAMPGLPLAVFMLAIAVQRVAEAGDHVGTSTTLIDPLVLVPLVAGLVAHARRSVPVHPWGTGLLAAAAVATLASYDVPLAAVVAALAGLALAATRVNPYAASGVAVVAVAAALPSSGLTALACAAAVAVALLVLRHVVGGALLPLASAGLLWSAAGTWSVDHDLRALPVLVVCGLVAIALPRVEVELAAAVAGLLATLAVVDDPTGLAIHLTLAGVLVTGSSLVHRDRRLLAVPGGLLLAAATWVRLADLGVTAPEPYTLPSALVLLALGLDRLRRDPGAATVALVPGLTLATVPSFLWVLVEPVSPRAVLLGGACLALVLAGSTLRWSAPIAVGGLVGALVVVREVAPYAGATPQWVLIGLAGTVLTVVGVTWEQRLSELRRAADYLGRLR